MDLIKIKEEMQFLTGVITNDIEYLLYLLLKDSKKEEVEESTDTNVKDSDYFRESSLEDWFDKL